MEKERDERAAHAEEVEAKMARLKNCIIKGGTLFDPLNAHPSLRTPAKTKTNKRRQTAAPKASDMMMALESPEFPKKEKDTRRKVSLELHSLHSLLSLAYAAHQYN